MKDDLRKMNNKGLKPLRSAPLDADEAIRAAQQVAPEAPPAVVEVKPAVDETSTVVSIRMAEGTAMAMAREAERLGITQRNLIGRALKAIGVEVAAIDLEPKAPPRRRVR